MYIGQSADLKKREKTHIYNLKRGSHPNCHLQRAWAKGERFTFLIIEECEPAKLNDREIFWIDHFDTFRRGYNQCLGGEATRGYHFQEETKRKISESKKGRKVSQETIDKRCETFKKHLANDEEFRKAYKERLKNRPHRCGTIGRKHTEKEKRAVGEKLKGKKISEEHKAKLREMYSGEKSITAKLTAYDVATIRYRFLCGERQIDIQKDYSVTPQTIYDIVRGRKWKSVPMDKDTLEKLVKGGKPEDGKTVSQYASDVYHKGRR